MSVIKWPGGKTQLLPAIRPLIPRNINTYCEPFVGGGAVLLDLTPDHAIINDANPELINLYRVVRDNPDDLVAALLQHVNTAEHFYAIRSLDRDPEAWAALSDIDRAARYLFLNKTCFNGLMRVNRHGQINSSFGRYSKPCICPKDSILELHDFLFNSDIDILCGDYTAALDRLDSGDFVYLDPPYAPVSKTANYASYTSSGFGIDEQIRLANACRDLDRRGVKWLVSNSSVPLIHDLYSNFIIDVVPAKRSINCKGGKRGPVDEVLIRNYSIPNSLSINKKDSSVEAHESASIKLSSLQIYSKYTIGGFSNDR